MDATTEPVEWTFTASAEIDPDSHGDGTIGVRKGAFSAMWRTEAPELKWSPAWERGNGWLAARGHLFAAGLLISPYTDGAPDPTRALMARSAGLDGGAVRYGPRGTWLGARASADGYQFSPYDETTIATPAPRLVSSADVIGG